MYFLGGGSQLSPRLTLIFFNPLVRVIFFYSKWFFDPDLFTLIFEKSLSKKFCQKILGPKNLWLGPKTFLFQKNFGSKKLLGPKPFWVQTNFESKQIFVIEKLGLNLDWMGLRLAIIPFLKKPDQTQTNLSKTTGIV